jgi:hypothetical protein
MDQAGIGLKLHLLETLDPAISSRLLATEFDNLSKAIVDISGTRGSLFGLQRVGENVNSLSVAQAEAVTKEAIELAKNGAFSPEGTYAIIQSQNRTGFDVLGGEEYKSIVTKHGSQWKKYFEGEATQDSVKLREELGVFITSDLRKTQEVLQSRLGSNFILTRRGGKFVVEMTEQARLNLANEVETAGAFALPNMTEEARIKAAIDKMPKDLTINDLNEKYSSLGLLGEFGTQIKETLEGKVSGGAGQDKVDGGEGLDRLGVDFTRVEQEYGLPSGYLSRTAWIESRGNPSAKNPKSSAGGLFQQIDSNAKAYGVTNRFDPTQSTIGAAKFAKDNTATLRRVLGRAPTGAELYLAHQQGPGGAAKLLSNPNALAVDLVGEKQVKLNGGGASMTGAQFASLWINKYNNVKPGTPQSTGTPDSFSEEDLASFSRIGEQASFSTDDLTVSSKGEGTQGQAATAPEVAEAKVDEAIANFVREGGAASDVSDVLLSQVKNIFMSFGDTNINEEKIRTLIEALKKVSA